MLPGFEHTYARLGPAFSTPQAPDPVSEPKLLLWNQSLADTLGFSSFVSQESVGFGTA